MKRLFDLIVSGVALLILWPVLLLTAVLVKVSSRGPALYRGVRAGRDGRPFQMFKFRTMVVGADKIGGSSTPHDDPRTTGLGRLLRRFKLDELPQLLNVFAGQMSFVGPRPQVLSATEEYTAEEQRLLTVRPGITDLASIKFRNEGEILQGEPDPDEAYYRLIHPEKVRLGLYYVDNRSLWLDLRILWRTLLVIAGLGKPFDL